MKDDQLVKKPGPQAKAEGPGPRAYTVDGGNLEPIYTALPQAPWGEGGKDTVMLWILRYFTASLGGSTAVKFSDME